LLSEGKSPQAQAAFEEVLERQPHELRALRALAQSHMAAKQPGAAIAAVRQHAEKHPSSPRVQYFLGDWSLRTGDPASAREAFERAYSLDASFVEANIALIRLDLAERQLPRARSRLTEVLAHDATNTEARLLLALLAEAEHQPDEAIGHYLRVVAEQPENFVALNNLAYRFAAEHRDLDEALRFAQKAKELAPENASVDDTLGWVYYLKGVYGTALRHFQDAAKQKPADALIQYHLAMTHFQLGDLETGRRTLDEALRLNPDAPEAAMAQKLLAQAKGLR
jgi:tetratricopeptide (TPR) repeat protein